VHIHDIFAEDETTVSFEFFPPKTAADAQALYENIAELETLHPSFVSVTYGAGGSTRQLTHDLVLRLKQTTTLDPIPHLTCVGHSELEIDEILTKYAEAGVSNILALGGDLPRDTPNYDRKSDAFQHAAQLVRFTRRMNASGVHPDRRGFGIGVAGFPEGHPATPNRLEEMDHLKAKVDAGADYICTQLFFDNHDFYDFRDRCELAGINVPIIAGIMPVTSLAGMKRMAQLALGARVPAKLQRALGRATGDADAVKRVGVHWATEQCRDLLDNQVRGIHFYTLNKSDATRQIYQSLGLRDSISLRAFTRPI
jgi:methylenetetrahydrofolate reductase (NADPH)